MRRWLRAINCTASRPNLGLQPVRLVSGGEVPVFGSIGGEDGGDAAGRGHDLGTPALRSPSQTRSIRAGAVRSSVIDLKLVRARDRV